MMHDEQMARDNGDSFAFPNGDTQRGMTLREHYAGLAMQALIADGVRYEEAARYGVKVANALLLELVRSARKQDATDARD